jgi:hypothetical protein
MSRLGSRLRAEASRQESRATNGKGFEIAPSVAGYQLLATPKLIASNRQPLHLIGSAEKR